MKQDHILKLYYTWLIPLVLVSSYAYYWLVENTFLSNSLRDVLWRLARLALLGSGLLFTMRKGKDALFTLYMILLVPAILLMIISCVVYFVDIALSGTSLNTQ